MAGGPETKRRKRFQEKVSKCDERVGEVKMGLGSVGRTSTRAGEAGAGREPGRDVPGRVQRRVEAASVENASSEYHFVEQRSGTVAGSGGWRQEGLFIF